MTNSTTTHASYLQQNIPSVDVGDDIDSQNLDFLIDDEAFADDFGLPSIVLHEEDLRFLRDFILSSALYVEQLENLLCEASDDFWQAREQAYRIITNALIGFYEYEMET